MAKQNEHGRIIATAAKATLLPIGCRRIGQSRCWISDQRYWIILIEFQPSAWAKGSYLNVTPHWLWLRYGANDYHPRPADFIPFENAERFTPLIENMAAVAARTVLDMRARFRTPEKGPPILRRAHLAESISALPRSSDSRFRTRRCIGAATV